MLRFLLFWVVPLSSIVWKVNCMLQDISLEAPGHNHIFHWVLNERAHPHFCAKNNQLDLITKKSEPNLRYSWVFFCLCTLLYCLQCSFTDYWYWSGWGRPHHHSTTFERRRSHHRKGTPENIPPWAASSNPPQNHRWGFCAVLNNISSWERDASRIQRLTPFRTPLYHAFEWCQEASFGSPPHNLLLCTALFTFIRQNPHVVMSSVPLFYWS